MSKIYDMFIVLCSITVVLEKFLIHCLVTFQKLPVRLNFAGQ